MACEAALLAPFAPSLPWVTITWQTPQPAAIVKS